MRVFVPLTILRVRQHPPTCACYSLRVDVFLFFIGAEFEGSVALAMFITVILGLDLLGLCVRSVQLRLRSTMYFVK